MPVGKPMCGPVSYSVPQNEEISHLKFVDLSSSLWLPRLKPDQFPNMLWIFIRIFEHNVLPFILYLTKHQDLSSFKTQFKYNPSVKPSQIPLDRANCWPSDFCLVSHCPVILHLCPPLDCLLLKDKYYVTMSSSFLYLQYLEKEQWRSCCSINVWYVFVLHEKQVLSSNKKKNNIYFEFQESRFLECYNHLSGEAGPSIYPE